MFSTTCSGRLAPVITVLTCGFFRHQAKPSCAILMFPIIESDPDKLERPLLEPFPRSACSDQDDDRRIDVDNLVEAFVKNFGMLHRHASSTIPCRCVHLRPRRLCWRRRYSLCASLGV